jgi:isoleucyl-tRNA synthetase
VRLSTNSDLYPLLAEYAAELPTLFIVSQVILEPGADLQVAIEKADGTKCERCWKYKLDIGSHPDFPTICTTCAEAIGEQAA